MYREPPPPPIHVLHSCMGNPPPPPRVAQLHGKPPPTSCMGSLSANSVFPTTTLSLSLATGPLGAPFHTPQLGLEHKHLLCEGVLPSGDL